MQIFWILIDEYIKSDSVPRFEVLKQGMPTPPLAERRIRRDETRSRGVVVNRNEQATLARIRQGCSGLQRIFQRIPIFGHTIRVRRVLQNSGGLACIPRRDDAR